MKSGNNNESCPPRGFVKWFLSWKGIVAILFLAGVSYYLFQAHMEHIALALPYLILLACPLMHIFGHRHGGYGKEDDKG